MGIGHLEGNRIIDFHSTDRSLQLGKGCHAILLLDRFGEGTGNLRDCLQAACDYPKPTEAVKKMNSTLGAKAVKGICTTFMPKYFTTDLEGFLKGAELNPASYLEPAGTPQFR